jgi:hypothetical protein
MKVLRSLLVAALKFLLPHLKSSCSDGIFFLIAARSWVSKVKFDKSRKIWRIDCLSASMSRSHFCIGVRGVPIAAYPVLAKDSDTNSHHFKTLHYRNAR